MSFKKGETVYAIGPGLGTFVRYAGRKSAVVEVDEFEYQVPIDAISPTTTVDDDEPVEWAGRTFGQLTADEKRRAARQAGKQLSAELTAMAPEIEKILGEQQD